MGSTTVVGIGVDPNASYNQPTKTLICGGEILPHYSSYPNGLGFKDCLKDGFSRGPRNLLCGKPQVEQHSCRLTKFGVNCCGDALLDHLVAKFLKKP